MEVVDIKYSIFLIYPQDEQAKYIVQVNELLERGMISKQNYIFSQDLDDWDFVDIKDLMQAVSEDNGFLEIAKIVSKRKELEQIGEMSATKVIISFLWIYEEIGKMIEVENETLVGHVSPEVSIASEQVDFSQFGYYSQLLELANDDITKIEQVSHLPYCDCYVYLAYKVKKAEFERVISEQYKKK